MPPRGAAFREVGLMVHRRGVVTKVAINRHRVVSAAVASIIPRRVVSAAEMFIKPRHPIDTTAVVRLTTTTTDCIQSHSGTDHKKETICMEKCSFEKGEILCT